MMSKRYQADWSQYYLDTLRYEFAEVYAPKMSKEHFDVAAKEFHTMIYKECFIFGQLMCQIPEVTLPLDSADRIPVRVLFVLNRPEQKLYKDYFAFKNSDLREAAHWVNQFMLHSIG